MIIAKRFHTFDGIKREVHAFNQSPNRKPIMKFTKEQAIQELRGQFTAKGKNLKLSERTINEAMDSLLLFAGEETELADFVTKAFPVIDSTNGNLIKENADAIAAWNAAHPAPGTPPATPPANPGTMTPEQLAAIFNPLLAQQLDPLKNELAGYRKEKTNEQLMADAVTLFNKENPKEHLKSWKDEAVRVAKGLISETDTPETVAAKIKENFNHYATLAGEVEPFIPAGQQGPQSAGEGSVEFYQKQRQELEKEGFVSK